MNVDSEIITTSSSTMDSSSLSCISELVDTKSTFLSPVWYCTFSPNGELIATCHGTPEICIRLWRRKSCKDLPSSVETKEDGVDWVVLSTLTGCHERTIRHVAFSPSNTILASASFDGTVGIWEELSSSPTMNDSYGMANTSANDMSSWECTAQLEGHDNEVKCVAWNASGTLLATCGRDKSVWIWECLLSMDNVYSGHDKNRDYGGDGEFECLAVLHGHSGDVKTIVFIPSNGQWGDGDEILISASYDDAIKCWAEDGGDWYCAATLSAHTSTVWSIASTPGGTRLVSASDDCSLAIWKCYTASEKHEMISQGQNVMNGTCSSDGLWKCVGKLESAHERVIYHVDCAPSCAGHGGIATVSSDTCLQIYREMHISGKTSSDAPLFALDARFPRAHGDLDINCIKWHPKNGKLSLPLLIK